MASAGSLSLFHTTDPLLSNSPVLVLYGPAATIGVTSSRIQVHVFTPAGQASFTRLAISPNSPFYSAVRNLPREEQGDEVCRSLAFGLKKYFTELPEMVKKTWSTEAKATVPSALFGDDHVAILASRMTIIENADEVVEDIRQAFAEQRLSWLDVDLVLPPGSIKELPQRPDLAGSDELDENQFLQQRYGKYAELVDCFGEAAFLPTSKMKRAPSKPSAIGRSSSFLRHHKENIRKELSELLNTETSYVDRLSDLQQFSTSIAAHSDSSGELHSIVSASLSNILDINSKFLASFRAVMQSTEQAALENIEASSDREPGAQEAREELTADTQGVGAIAKCLCEWFPRFEDSYSEYLGNHAHSIQLLRSLMRGSEWVRSPPPQLQEVSEQKIASLLIEPVQRLPRYNLYIDSILKQLPMRHPATRQLLHARNTITQICDKDSSGIATMTIVERLRARISGWPVEVQIKGRLVTAADFVELVPPFISQSCDGEQGILLLFTDGIVFLERRGPDPTAARSLLTEIETGQIALRQVQSRPSTPQDLRFVRRVQLDAFECLGGRDGQVLHVLTHFALDPAAFPTQQAEVDSYQVLRLEGLYDHKVDRFIEEVTKTKVEGRFSEAERESAKWEVRATDSIPDTANLFCAVFEDSNPDHTLARAPVASIRVIVDIDKHSQRPRAGQNGIRTVVSASPLRDGLWRLTFDSIDGTMAREHVPVSDLVSVIRRCITALASARFGIDRPAMTARLLVKNLDILSSINMQLSSGRDEAQSAPLVRERQHRPKSPMKLFSTFLSTTASGSQTSNLMKKDLPALPPPTQLTRVPPIQPIVKPPSRESRPSSKDQQTPKSMSSKHSIEQLQSPFKKLEDTLSTYMLALQARKGNIVGRSLKMRSSADELVVNELYNRLLEDPNMMVAAAQATVDVLFAAFEKFVNVAWRDQIGQLLPFAMLQDIQSKAETLFPVDFDEFFRSSLSTLSLQNQRAFKSIMKLLADLLDGTANDGDRGALTAAFAELLITEGDPHDYIALIDRFVDDPDTYFGEPLEDLPQKEGDGATNLQKRARSINSASINSNTSSLRKKFGFSSLARENSKSEQESKVATVWRTLSKGARTDASPAGSISKSTIHRSQSTDIHGGGLPPRPLSQESRSHNVSACVDERSFTSTTSTQNLALSTTGQCSSLIPMQPPRKKRRSSLSDLKVLEAAQKSPQWSPPASRPLPTTQRLDDKSLPNSPMPSTPSSKGGSGRYSTPGAKGTPRPRLPPSFQMENSPVSGQKLAAAEQRTKIKNVSDEVVITARPTSHIPSLGPRAGSLLGNTPPPQARGSGLSERRDAGNAAKQPSPQPDKAVKPSYATATEKASRKKLRMQSPQKLRERLQNEQSAVTATHILLQGELSKIGDDLTSIPARTTSVRSTRVSHGRTKSSDPTTDSMDVAQRILKMEGRLPKEFGEFDARIRSIQSDLATSLNVSESKCKKLDELYREANGENEALYARFNDELGRILKVVRGGEGVEELKKKLKETQDEAARLKRENGRLKRENVGLRSQLRE